MTPWETFLNHAGEIGYEWGKDAAAWYFQVETNAGIYQKVFIGIECNDPEVLDTFPSWDPWEEESEPYVWQVIRKLGLDLAMEEASDALEAFRGNCLVVQVLTVCSLAFDSGVEDGIARQCRKHLKGDD